ncbi:hypothetical protein EGI20_07400 [Aquitalea sp. S1-19]|nr:hypothetical protein [Aquitalea sp. S1-19]
MLKRPYLPCAVALAFSPLLPAVELADVPLYLAVDMAPNVLLTLDDSGSMAYAYAPDSVDKTASSRRFKAASFNGIAYNPRFSYPIPQVRGRNYSTRFNQAYINGFNPGQGSVNLDAQYLTYANCNFSLSKNYCQDQDKQGQKSAFYTLWYADAGRSKPYACNASDPKDDDCYLEIVVGSSDDIAAGSSAERKQNFANWYSFYRTRAQTMTSGALQAIDGIDDGRIRLGWQALTACNRFDGRCQGYDGRTRDNRLRVLDSTQRERFYQSLERFKVYGWTPLRSALQRTGSYLEQTGRDSPWAEQPYVDKGTEYSCRKNFSVVFTDGLWNQDGGFNIGGNIDGSNHTLPADAQGKRQSYSPRPLFRDSNNNSLADTAFAYWASDLRPDLANNVPASFSDRSGDATAQYWNPKNNPATWQHMVTFGIGLGLGETLITHPQWAGSTWAGEGYKALMNGTTNWPAVDSSGKNALTGHVYDLWHAAINSRGQFFSADDPKALSEAFRQTFASIIDASPTAAPLSANSGAIQQSSLLYQAGFDSKDWHGQLQAWQLKADSTLGQVKWDAARQLPAPAARRLFTLNGSSPRLLDSCSSLSDAQLQALGPDLASCNLRLQWLRGDASQEVRNGGSLRNRPLSVLGDIINSAPAYAGSQDFGWSKAEGLANSERNSYAGYLAAKRVRTPLLLAGANDGILHGFDADNGRELFGFVPPAVFDNLKALSEPAYSHRYTVDGSPTLGDAYYGGSWKTVLVSGLNKGGRAVYALNVSDPDNFSSQHVLWQFTDPDLGYSYGQPQITRLNNGDWAAVFGSGYDSARSALFVVRLSDGKLLQKILLGQDQGLAGITLYDQDKDGVTDAAYAGDLAGQLWKFDLSASTPAAWKTANQGKPLFITPPGQAITTAPLIGPHPQGNGNMVYFGSGRYLGPSDINDQAVQAFYAVQDKGSDNGIILGAAQLQTQTLEEEITQGGAVLRKTSSHSVDWSRQYGWLLSLSRNSGERVITTPLLNHGRILFTTMLPSTDPCVPGGDGWLMALRADSGGRTLDSTFDLNGDGVIDSKDKIGGNSASGIRLAVGIPTAPTFVENPATPGLAPVYVSGTAGKIELINIGVPLPPPTGQLKLKRIYWKQIL